MQLSPLTFDDCENAAVLHQISFFKGWDEEVFNEFLQDKLVHGLKIEKENELCGYILWRELLDEAEVITLVVAPNWQRKGIGFQLLQSLCSDLKKSGISQLFIEVAEDNEGAKLFYINQGFVFLNERPKYYLREGNRYVSALNFVKKLL